MPRIRATYHIETAFPLAEAAATMAGEQSTGTFLRVPGETDALREQFAATVDSLTETAPVSTPTLPGAGYPRGWDGILRTATVTLSWPLANIGPSLPNLLATIAGNLSELRQFSGLKLLDLDLPPEFLSTYLGPQFGIAGTRKAVGVHGRPLLGTILKPSLGMDPATTARQVRTLAEAGIDFIKDDELQTDAPHCPFADRVRAVLDALREVEHRTGHRVLYAANLTGELDQMLRRHDQLVAAGGQCLMVSLNSVGLTGFQVLRKHSALIIHGHRNGWGMLGRSPAAGMGFVAYQKLWRLAGIDHTHVNGLRNKFCESDASVIASARACLTPMFPAPHPGCEVMPVFSSGQTVWQVPDTLAAMQNLPPTSHAAPTDLIYACGGGILGHPGGPAAGVQALREAWEAAGQGTPLAAYAETHPALREALRTFKA